MGRQELIAARRELARASSESREALRQKDAIIQRLSQSINV